MHLVVELANSSHSHKCVVGPNPGALKLSGTADVSNSAARSFSDVMCPSGDLDFDDNGGTSATVLGQKIVVSVQSGKGKRKVTEVEGIPARYSLELLLKTLQKMYACGGHLAKVKGSEEALVLHGKFSAKVTKFLIQEGIADSDSIIHRG